MTTSAVEKLDLCGFARLLPTAVPQTKLTEASALPSVVLALTLAQAVGS